MVLPELVVGSTLPAGWAPLVGADTTRKSLGIHPLAVLPCVEVVALAAGLPYVQEALLVVQHTAGKLACSDRRREQWARELLKL